MYNRKKSYIIVIYLLSITKVYCDYYSTLGVKRNATEREIEKAFRKKAKVLHPDANPGNEQEFAKVSNAYEVLKDPSKRKLYDQYGEDGLKSEGSHSHPYQHYYGDGTHTFFTFEGFDMDDIFSNIGFGTRQPGGQEHFKFQSSLNFEDTVVEEISPKQFNSSVRNVRVLNLYYFYMSNSRSCQTAHRPFVETATKFKGAINIYAINCDKYGNFCSRHVRAVPHLIAYTPESSEPVSFEHEEYTLKLEIWISKIIPSELLEIRSYKELKLFVENQPVTHVVTIVKKSLYLTLLKSLSVYVKSKIKIGFIRASNTELIEHFKKSKTETARIFYMQELESKNVKSIEMTHENFSDVLLWLNLKQNEYKKKNVGEYRELTKELMDSGECGMKDNQFCFIFIKYGNRFEQTLHNELHNISQKYIQDAVKIRYITANNQHKFVSAFGLSSRCPAAEVCCRFLAYRGKRKKFKIMQATLTPGNVTKFIDDVITNLITLNEIILHDPKIIDYSKTEF